MTYKLLTNLRTYCCYYCGNRSDTVDHFPPVSRRYDVDMKGILIDCCQECNRLAGNSIQLNLEDRKKYILKKKERKIKLKENKAWVKKLSKGLKINF